MTPWHILFAKHRAERGLAAACALSRAGIASYLWVTDNAPLPDLGSGQRALVLDYDPRSGLYEKKWKDANCLFIYCTGYTKADSHDIVAWCRKVKKTHLWESLPPWLVTEYDAAPLLFPAATGPDPDPANPCCSSSIPVVGVLRDGLSHRTQRRVQQEYLSLPAKTAELLLLVESPQDRSLYNRAKAVNIWYVPGQEEEKSAHVWSQELTRLLILGARIAAVSPPPCLSGAVQKVENLREALMSERQNIQTDVASLLRKIDHEFVASILMAEHKNHSRTLYP